MPSCTMRGRTTGKKIQKGLKPGKTQSELGSLGIPLFYFAFHDKRRNIEIYLNFPFKMPFFTMAGVDYPEARRAAIYIKSQNEWSF